MPLEIVPPGTRYDFVGKWRLATALSLGLILAGAIAALPAVKGARFGIDFAGGHELQVRFLEASGEEGRIRRIVEGVGIEGPTVVRFGDASENEFLIRFLRAEEESEDTAVVNGILNSLEEGVGPLDRDRVRLEFVGPRVGAELRRDGLQALGLACGLILMYVAFRFTMRFAPGAVVALVHDVAITTGILVMLGVEFDLKILAALLAIVGYSLNDTIIVYDRIRENMALHTKFDLPEVVNRSVNQTLSRTLLTSGTTMAALLALLFFGGEVIRSFSIAMAIGIVVGTYSSVYIAAPTLLLLERQFGGPGSPARDVTPPRGRKAARSRKGTERRKPRPRAAKA